MRCGAETQVQLAFGSYLALGETSDKGLLLTGCAAARVGSVYCRGRGLL